MKELRNPESGCPWDIEQDFKSIAPHTIEEAYEVADAINKEDMTALKDELGDLLFQVVYHARMADEAGYFDFDDVARHVNEKMIQRHPHVFGDESADAASDVNEIWDRQKDKERKSAKQSVMDEVALALPALLRAQKLQKKAARQGFEWTNLNDILDKLDEEIAEFKQVVSENGCDEEKTSEMGDILFVLANVARHLDVNAETALRSTNEKFVTRYKGIEDDLGAKEKNIADQDIQTLLELWEAQKRKTDR